jgi:Flp pilus assembly pilin Flp
MRRLWFAKNRKGQALMEYVLLIALVAACLVAVLGLTRDAARGAYSRTSAALGPVAPAGFGGGGGRGTAGGSWHPGGDPRPAADSSGQGDPADSSASGAEAPEEDR